MSKTVEDFRNHPKEEDDKVEYECIWCDGTGIVTKCPFFGPVYEECICNWL